MKFMTMSIRLQILHLLWIHLSHRVKEFYIDEDVLGINLSPLMAKYLTGGALRKWEQTAAKR
jgi:hypothetical protein